VPLMFLILGTVTYHIYIKMSIYLICNEANFSLITGL